MVARLRPSRLSGAGRISSNQSAKTNPVPTRPRATERAASRPWQYWVARQYVLGAIVARYDGAWPGRPQRPGVAGDGPAVGVSMAPAIATDSIASVSVQCGVTSGSRGGFETARRSGLRPPRTYAAVEERGGLGLVDHHGGWGSVPQEGVLGATHPAARVR